MRTWANMAVAIIAGLILTGRMMQIQFLIELGVGPIQMLPVSCAMFLLASLSLQMMGSKLGNGNATAIVAGCSGAILALVLVFVLIGVVNTNPGLVWLFGFRAEPVQPLPIVGVPAIPTLFCFALIGLAGIGWLFGIPWPHRLAGLIVAVLGARGLIGYATGDAGLYGALSSYFPGMDQASALCFLLLGLSAFVAGPEAHMAQFRKTAPLSPSLHRKDDEDRDRERD